MQRMRRVAFLFLKQYSNPYQSEAFITYKYVKNLLTNLPVHSLIVAVIPVLSLFTINLGIISVLAIWRVVMGSILLWGILILLFRIYYPIRQAHICVTAVLIVFYGLSPIYLFIKPRVSWDTSLLNLLVVLAIEVLFTVFWLIRKKNTDVTGLTKILNIAATSMMMLPMLQIFGYVTFVVKGTLLADSLENTVNSEGIFIEDKQIKPDIYYVIFDSYGRADRMLEEYKYDSSEFLGTLESQGFYVAQCSNANYSQTLFSLASSLNMNYIDTFVQSEDDADLTILTTKLIKNSLVAREFQAMGYQFVTFETNYQFININEADIFYRSESRGFFQVSDFERAFINLTPFVFFENTRQFFGLLFSLPSFRNEHIRIFGYEYDTDNQIMEDLIRVSKDVDSPKFVYAHIMAPHPPFVFTPEGAYTDNDYQFGIEIEGPSYSVGYINEVRYLNKVIPELVRQIQENSAIPPIIILQGDHGFSDETTNLDSRIAILNAYSLPGIENNDILYENISPVNTFRLILRHYFNREVDLLPDKSFYMEDSTLDGLRFVASTNCNEGYIP